MKYHVNFSYIIEMIDDLTIKISMYMSDPEIKHFSNKVDKDAFLKSIGKLEVLTEREKW